MKRKILSLAIILFIFNNILMPVSANADIHIWTQAAVLIESETGKVLYEQDADKKLPPASLTKMMTFLITLEAIKSGKVKMSDKISISDNASRVGSSTYKLVEGDIVDLEELINALMIVSSNGAAVAISEHVTKTEEEFIDLMNKRAKEIGMKNTKFINSHGLPVYGADGTLIKNNLSTAHDLAILAQYLVENFREETLTVTSKKVFDSKYKSFTQLNTNQLLHEVEGVDGLKTGFTGNAGYCLAFTKVVKANKIGHEDMRLIGITLGAGNDNERAKESKKLLEYGSTKYIKRLISKANEYVTDIYLYNDKRFKIRVIKEDKLSVVAKSEDMIKEEKYNIFNLEYPVFKGQKVGEVIYTLYDNTEVKINLISENEITRLPLLFRIKLWFKDLFSRN